MCKVLDISRSSYYKRLNKTESKRSIENKQFKEKILKIYHDSKKRYGAPKIHNRLVNKGYKISLKRVQKLMKELGIRSITAKKFKPYKSTNSVEERENILNRDFSTTTINEKWVADITYIHTLKDGWCYLSSVMDLHSKKIIGYCFSRKMTDDIVIKALNNAYSSQRPDEEVILHTDLGSQYTSKDFELLTQDLNIIHSFSKKGCPYDNACIESFHAILKKEEVNNVKYYDYSSAKLAIFKFIESWYNRKRIHGSINYMTPEEYEIKARNIA